jgi:TP901 family phage tail tape measure protein
MKAGLKDMKAGFASMAIPAAAVAAATGLAVKKFVGFSGQMAAVKSVVVASGQKWFPGMEDAAKRLGATTAFTAIQAGEAMENLSRAGFTQQQVLAAIGPTLNAAEADGLDLAAAAGIVSKNLARFGMEAKEANIVADQLAFVSAKTNTNMAQLEEGLKFMGPTARDLGLSLADTAAGLGAMADVGLQATLGGTALKNALLKIAQAAKKGKLAVAGQNVEIVKTDTGALDMLGTFQNLIKRLKDIPDKTERAAISMKVLGLRGLGAKTAFEALSDEKIVDLFGELNRNADGTITRLGGVTKKAVGAATTMAEIRRASPAGQFRELSSAAEGVTINFGEAIGKAVNLGSGVKGLTKFIGEAAAAFQFFSKSPEMLDQNIQGVTGIRKSVLLMVKGITLGLRDVGKTLSKVFGAFKFLAGGADTGTARLVTTVVGLAAAFAPVMLAVKGATLLFKGFGQVALGSMKLAAGALGAFGKIGGGLLKKLPGVARLLPGAAGKLVKAVSGVEQITAAPVRVVNLHELGAAGALGGAVTGGKAAGGAAAQAGGIARLRAGLAGFVGKLGGMGTFLNTNFSQLASGSTTLAGKLGAVGAASAGIAAAGVAGFKFGQWLDDKLGISDKIADGLHNLFRAGEIEAANKRVQAHTDLVTLRSAQKMANTFAQFSQRGVAQVGIEGGKQAALTREFAAQRITKFLEKQGKSDTQIADILKSMEATFRGIKENPTKINLKIDGKTIAAATAKRQNENAERSGKTSPGAARRAAQGGR